MNIEKKLKEIRKRCNKAKAEINLCSDCNWESKYLSDIQGLVEALEFVCSKLRSHPCGGCNAVKEILKILKEKEHDENKI